MVDIGIDGSVAELKDRLYSCRRKPWLWQIIYVLNSFQLDRTWLTMYEGTHIYIAMLWPRYKESSQSIIRGRGEAKAK